MAHPGTAGHGLIWLASYPKSGNTWLRAFLANYLLDPPKPITLDALRAYIHGDSTIDLYRRFTGRTPERHSEAALAMQRLKLQERLAAKAGHDLFIKTHNRIGHRHGLPIISPRVTVGAIYVLRNPLDVCVSLRHYLQVSQERALEFICDAETRIGGNAEQVVQYVGDWTGHLRSWTEAPGLNCHVMRYEDMLASPGASFSAVLAFLGMSEDPARLDRAMTASSFASLQRQEAQQGFAEIRTDAPRFFRSGTSGQWRSALRQDQIDRLIARHGDEMRRHGYLEDL